MSQDTELEVVLDGEDSSNEQETSSTEIVLEEDANNTSSQESKKNESNFKALYKSNKEKEKALAENKALIAKQASELEEWRNLNPDYHPKGEDRTAKMEVEIFGLKNPDAQSHIDDVRATALEYGLPLDKAWKIVKADLPTESKSVNDFDFKSAPVIVKKSLADITPEQALKLPKEQQAKWRKLHLGME